MARLQGRFNWRRKREVGLLVQRTRERFPEDKELQKLCDELVAARKLAASCPDCEKRRQHQRNWRKEARRRDKLEDCIE